MPQVIVIAAVLGALLVLAAVSPRARSWNAQGQRSYRVLVAFALFITVGLLIRICHP